MSNEQTKQPPQAHFTFNEAKITVMALANQIEDLEATSKDPRIPWTPESRRAFGEMLAAARSARDKFTSLTGIDPTLPDYQEGDDLIFLTKPS
jgi:hypothetical protein